MTVQEQPDFERLLEFLKQQRGFDFTGYKRTSLQRRVAKRMEEVGISSHRDYLEHLEVSPGEFTELFNTILINVTGFFRDPVAWDYIRSEVLPELLERKGPADDIRVWSAGCASGEEPYSVAMLLADALGDDAFQDRVKIYATDIDEDALNMARHATYPEKALEEVPEELRERCFEQHDHHYMFRRDLRRALIFGRNDLVQDAPISRIDLLLCRNTLMYFTAEAQSRILGRLNFALRPTGYIFLGKSEMLLTHGDLFQPVHLKTRVFTKVTRETLRERLAFMGNGEPPAVDRYDRLRDGAFDLAPVPQIVVDYDGMLAAANQQARAVFGLGTPDIGLPLSDLEISYRPAELRGAIEQAYSERRAVELGDVVWKRSGAERHLRVAVTPLPDDGTGALGAAIAFNDVTQEFQLRDELQRSKRELEVAYEELQSTVEELETTNEELQSTNEELETTNEELQSTNEELETMNEELHSTNQELETINDELRQRSAELNSVNASFEAILKSLHVAVVVVDPNAVVRIWNAQADDIWGVRAEEAVGQHVYGVDMGMRWERLGEPLRSAFAGDMPEPLELAATNRRGRPFKCKVVT